MQPIIALDPIHRRIEFHIILCNLTLVYAKSRLMVNNAHNVIIMQDELTQDDVEFYTPMDGIESNDRLHVSAYSIEKPIRIHPIRYASCELTAQNNLRKCYERSICKDGKCIAPIMVFVSSKMKCEYLMYFSKELAEDVGANPERIFGIWSSVKGESDFLRRFCSKPNDVVHEANVVLSTSVVGWRYVWPLR